VIATGPRSEIGRIGQSLNELEAEPPRLQAQIRRLVRLAAAAGGAVSLLAIVYTACSAAGGLVLMLVATICHPALRNGHVTHHTSRSIDGHLSPQFPRHQLTVPHEIRGRSISRHQTFHVSAFRVVSLRQIKAHGLHARP
jgi:hypothetical protein